LHRHAKRAVIDRQEPAGSYNDGIGGVLQHVLRERSDIDHIAPKVLEAVNAAASRMRADPDNIALKADVGSRPT